MLKDENKDHSTPLHIAVHKGYETIVKICIEKGKSRYYWLL